MNILKNYNKYAQTPFINHRPHAHHRRVVLFVKTKDKKKIKDKVSAIIIFSNFAGDLISD